LSAPPASTADVVIVAAGSSSRMNGLDKLLSPIGGRPLLAWALRRFAQTRAIERIVVVTAAERVEAIEAADWLPDEATVVAGGGRRQESVAAGIAELEAGGADRDRIVLVHDGARPAIPPLLAGRVIEAVAAHGAAVPVVPVIETLKRIDGDVVAETVDRTGLALAQTPQGVRLGLLRDAYARFPPSGPDTFTDEASLLEACTIPVHVVRGSVDNLKVTYPIDLVRAGRILDARRVRVGLGEDTHPFGPGEPLALGGITIPGAPRLSGHSDGDVVLHAVANALLGAAGLGDLGRLFPADAGTPEGIASHELLTEVVHRVHVAEMTPVRVDVTIVGARPRLVEHLDAIRDRVAELTWMTPHDVSVKASTGNLAGIEGAGRGISARAIATVEPKDYPLPVEDADA
jgi:2-C-methyl-D-erythritol 4-phosphate cytidylyltransferase/2-C-methyl-D-erythritol 2,4-cyclodiphosphate synthase